ncbi:MAG: YCF48-related protein [Flammeovirgaceae bacterium]|nr:YCF48-related protein [Flammeovirgaceae bacterium]
MYAYSWLSNKLAYYSDDMGLTWVLWQQLTPAGKILFLDNKLFKGNNYSTNNGQTWIQFPMPNPSYSTLSGLAGGYYFMISSNGIYRSTDLQNWELHSSGLSKASGENYFNLDDFIIVGNHLLVYDKIADLLMISSNFGQTWSAAIPKMRDDYGIRDYFIEGNNIYIAMNDGLFMSNDNGATWQSITTFGSTVNHTSNVFFKHNNNLFTSVLASGLYRSQDMGLTWQAQNNHGLEPMLVSWGFMEEHNSGLYLYGYSGLCRSTDGGQTWQKLPTPPFLSVINLVFVGNRIVVTSYDAIYYSDDHGNTWTKSVSAPTKLTRMHSHNGVLYAVSSSSAVYKSTDGGVNWSLINFGSVFSNSPVNAIAYVFGFASKGDTLFLANDFVGVIYTTNEGNTWTVPNNNLINSTQDFGSYGLKLNDNKLYLLSDFGSLLVSSDWAETWSVFSKEPIPSEFYDIVFAGNSSIVSQYGGIAVTNDNGNTWEYKNEGLPFSYPTPNYDGTAFSKVVGNKVYLATWSGKVYTRDLNTLIDPTSTITGQVYNDVNNNGTKDPGEAGMPGVLIEVQPDNVFYPTDANGYYKAFTKNTTATLKPIVPVAVTTISPSQYALPFANGPQDITGKNFALGLTPNINDIAVKLVNATAARPGFQFKYTVSYKNIGTTTRTGTVHLNYDSKLEYISASLAPTAINNGNQVEWAYTNLQPGQTANITVTFKVPANVVLIGQQLSSLASVFPVNDDVTPADNTNLANLTITGSYDPNDKQVNPTGNGAQGLIPTNTEELLYTIRFQNLGTDTAFTVSVVDTLSQALDAGSLKMVSASHTNSYVIDNGVVKWQFDNIKLPHAAKDEPGSHGHITYSVKPKLSLPEGTTITNKADIYFDFNPPITTNTVTNTFNIVPTIQFSTSIKQYGDSFTLNANTNSTGTITYSLVNDGTNTGALSLNGPNNQQATATKSGIVNVMATVSASGLYQQASKTILVTINKATLTAKAENKTRAYGAENPSATVSYTGFLLSDNESSLTTPPKAALAPTATATSPAGSTHVISLTTGEDDNYSILHENGILTITQASQTINFASISNKLNTAAPFTITATASSGLPVAFAIESGPAKIAGTTITLTGNTGTVVVKATQVGDNNYTAASPVTQSFEVEEDVVLGAEQQNDTELKIYPNPANDILKIENKRKVKATLSISDAQGKTVKTATLEQAYTELNIHTLPQGIYTVKITYNKEQIVYRIVVGGK